MLLRSLTPLGFSTAGKLLNRSLWSPVGIIEHASSGRNKGLLDFYSPLLSSLKQQQCETVRHSLRLLSGADCRHFSWNISGEAGDSGADRKGPSCDKQLHQESAYHWGRVKCPPGQSHSHKEEVGSGSQVLSAEVGLLSAQAACRPLLEHETGSVLHRTSLSAQHHNGSTRSVYGSFAHRTALFAVAPRLHGVSHRPPSRIPQQACGLVTKPWAMHGSGMQQLAVPSSSPSLPGRTLRTEEHLGVPWLQRSMSFKARPVSKPSIATDHSLTAVRTALITNVCVFLLKIGVWAFTSSSVMLAESVHSLADVANQCLLAYGLMSSKREPDATHPYGYTREQFIWSLISAVGILCLGAGITIVHGLHGLYDTTPVENVSMAALVVGGALLLESISLAVAFNALRQLAAKEKVPFREYLLNGHDSTTVAVFMEDAAAVVGLGVAAVSLAAVAHTGNPVWDAVGSIVVGHLLGVVALFLISRNRAALLGRSMEESDMRKVKQLLDKDPVVDAVYDCKSEVIGPGQYRFKSEIDFNGQGIVQRYLQRVDQDSLYKEVRTAASSPSNKDLEDLMAKYGEELVGALGFEVDRLEKEIQGLVPGIRHVDLEAHNPDEILTPCPGEALEPGSEEALKP